MGKKIPDSAKDKAEYIQWVEPCDLNVANTELIHQLKWFHKIVSKIIQLFRKQIRFIWSVISLRIPSGIVIYTGDISMFAKDYKTTLQFPGNSYFLLSKLNQRVFRKFAKLRLLGDEFE